jgi:hypothetical protein
MSDSRVAEAAEEEKELGTEDCGGRDEGAGSTGEAAKEREEGVKGEAVGERDGRNIAAV